MTTQPPVIPQIAQAYQNDPRTLLALQAMKAGSSTAPVAGGKWGMADGIARVLQGLGGTLANNQTEKQYGTDQATLLAQRQARGVDGLTGAAGGTPAVAAPDPNAPPPASNIAPLPSGSVLPPPAQASDIAGALGAPPPAAPPPPSSPGIPMAAVPNPMPPGVPPAPGGMPMAAPQGAPMAGGPQAQGGGPMGRPPFPSSASAGPQVIPPVPAPLVRPDAPTPAGPVRSPMLDAAYRVMADANPYESADGQDMYNSGLSDQSKLNEAAAQRQQDLAKLGYASDLSQYADSQGQDRAATYATRAAAQSENFQAGQADTQRTFTAGQSSLERANQVQLENMRTAGALAVEKAKASALMGPGGTALNADERAALSTAVGTNRIDLKGITKFQAKVVAQALIDNPNLNAIQLHAIAQLDANPAAQQKAMVADALPTIIQNTRAAGQKLNFPDWQFAGKAQAFAKGQFNDPDFVAYMNSRADALQSIAQVMGGAGVTDKRIQLELNAAPDTMSPKAFDAWAQSQLTQLRPRTQEYEKRGLLPQGSTAAVDAAMGAIAPTGGVPQRKPGETVSQYLARTGG